MDIHFKTGKPTQHTLTVTEKRGIRSTLDIMVAVCNHLEEPFSPDDDDAVDFHGTAGLLLQDGFEAFVNRYAPVEPTPEPPETGKGA